MRPDRVSRREVVIGALASLAAGVTTSVAEGDMAQESRVLPGYGDGQLVAVGATLRGYGGRTPIGVTFFEALGLSKREYRKLTPASAAGDPAEYVLFSVHHGIGPGGRTPADPVRHFEAAFLRAARWLLDRPEGTFDEWREQGRRAEVRVGLHLSSTQWGRLDGAPNRMVLPPKFLLACSGAGLPVVFDLYC
jgi:hypothetical protein